MEPDLVSDVGSSIADISVHLAHDTNVLVAVEQRVLLVSDRTHPARGMRSLVRLEAGIGEDYDETFRVLVVRSNGDVLLCHKLGEGWRRQGLGSCDRERVCKPASNVKGTTHKSGELRWVRRCRPDVFKRNRRKNQYCSGHQRDLLGRLPALLLGDDIVSVVVVKKIGSSGGPR